MRKSLFVFLTLALVSCTPSPIVSVVRDGEGNVKVTKGDGSVSTHQVLLPAGPTPTPSSSSQALSVSNLRFDTTSNSLTPRFDADGVEKFDVYLNGEKKATGVAGSDRSYYLPNLSADTQYRVKLDFFGKNGGRAVLEQDARTLAVGSTPTPSPGVTPAPTVDSPIVYAGLTSVTIRVSATNANLGNAVRLRVNSSDFHGSVNSDISVTGLTPGQVYGAEAFVTGPGGTTSRQFSFSTASQGNTDKTVASYWRTAAENYTSAVSWSTREWTLDSSSEGGLKIPLNGSKNYNVRIEASNGQVQSADYTNSFVELRPLPANLAPYQVRVRVDGTDVLTLRIEKK